MTLTDILLIIVILTVGGVGFLLWRRDSQTMPLDGLKGQLEQITLMSSNLQERVSEQFQRQERNLNETLRQQTEKTTQRLTDLQSRLAVIDKANASLTELSAQTTRLENVLSNKQARGAYGEMQLENLVQQILPPNAYQFQATLSNGARPDCLLNLPNPPGPITIDAKFPLEAWYELGEATDDAATAAARKKLAAALKKHVNDIADKYILLGETADSAILFLPSEAVYAEMHTHLTKAVEESFKRRVYITSPTTLMATLNTVRAILRDVKMREQATVIQAEVRKLLDDIGRLNTRVQNLDRHFGQAQKDIHDITTSTQKITSRGDKIEQIDVEDDAVAEETQATLPDLAKH